MATVERYGGKRLTGPSPVHAIEGEAKRPLMTIVSFDTKEEAMKLFDSEDWKEINKIRTQCVETDILLVE